MKITFWLLDINSETRNGTAELWLWGIAENGERVLVIDRNFVAYFYAVVEEGFDPSKVAEEIRKTHNASIVKLEVAPRKFFGKPVQTVKVYCRNPDEAAKLARTLRNARRSPRLPRRRHSPLHAIPHHQQRGSVRMARSRRN